jgi:hypothetical protein
MTLSGEKITITRNAGKSSLCAAINRDADLLDAALLL